MNEDNSFQVALEVKTHLPTQEIQETQVQSLGQEDHLEEEMATHSSNLVWEIPWADEPGGLQSMGLQKSWTRPSTHTLNVKESRSLCFLRSESFRIRYSCISRCIFLGM